jgi:poly-gamma-glutamate system protein
MAFLLIRSNWFVPRKGGGKAENVVLLLFFLSLVFFLLTKVFPSREAAVMKEEMTRASGFMKSVSELLRECRQARGLSVDEDSDINRTGLIGLEYSQITTSIGSLEAKRTTTNPNMAGLLVFLLKKAGVERGDAVAVGASSSFPALIVAVLSAAKAMGLDPLVIVSLGSSQWGANHPGFHWLDMHECLLKRSLFLEEPIALSLGGDHDSGEDMDAAGRDLLSQAVAESGILFLREPDLQANVNARVQLFLKKAGERKIKAFLNIGGSWSSMGTDAGILKLSPGLVRIKHFSPAGKRGMIFRMAELEIPVVHLLYIKGLVNRYGLPWDPVPLPQPGEGKLYAQIEGEQTSFVFLAASYLLCVLLIVCVWLKSSK